MFKHESLDHTEPSIRLLRFFDAEYTEDTLLRLAMKHATMKANPHYTCLSYRWGDDVPTNRVLLNGKEIYVRKNLFDFLKMQSKRDARNNASYREHGRLVRKEQWYWIDALCIDQDNVAERNHQVQQMGNIYHNADRVFLWLGTVQDAGSLVDYMYHAATAVAHGWETRLIQQDRRMEDHILGNEYWRRAWVTQEVVLARLAIVLVNHEKIDLDRLIAFMVRVYPFMSNNQGTKEDERMRQLRKSAFAQFMIENGNLNSLQGTPLFELLAQFKDRDCSIRHDRIFSLLSLCGEGTRLKVDYSLTKEELMFETLNVSPEQLCFCTAAVVAKSLELHKATSRQSFTPKDPGASRPFIELDVTGIVQGAGPWRILSSTPRGFVGDQSQLVEGSIGGIFNMQETCPVQKKFRLCWKQPTTLRERQIVWLEPFPKCDTQDLQPVCEYGKGFRIFQEDPLEYLWPKLAVGEAVHDHETSQTQPDPRLSSRYTVRMSFRNLAKVMRNERVKLCNNRCASRKRLHRSENVNIAIGYADESLI